MKKILLVLTVVVFSINIQAQQRFNGYVVTNANDTIKCRFSLEMNIFNDSLFYDSGISDRAKIFKENGEKVKYLPTELKTVFITGPKQGDYKFVSLEQDQKHFFHERIKGKLSFYILYKGNISGGFPLQMHYFLKNGILVQIKGSNARKKFAELIIDFPELYEKWIDSDKFYKLNQFEEVINLYNEHFK
ncbi:MAG: hypothetical protein K9I26_08725 [Flavobacterium sp.]|nr:hypothetical protein [Flavobacterium sp.]